jgi:arabinofuranosyltransferase
MKKNPLLIFLILSLVLLAIRVVYGYNPNLLLDDAYISFRYAANFAAGQGLVFNPGEWVEGYTSFLWTLLLGVGRRLGFAIPAFAMLLSGLAALGVLWIMYLFAQRWLAQRPGSIVLAGLPLLLFAGLGAAWRYVLSGMETLLFTFLAVSAVYALLYSRRAWMAGLLFAVAALARPEGVLFFILGWAFALFFPAVALRGAYHERRALLFLELLGGFAVLYLPYFAWRWSYYGEWLPNPYYAKIAGWGWNRLVRGWWILRSQVSGWGYLPLLLLAIASLPAIFRPGAPDSAPAGAFNGAVGASDRPIWLLFIALVASALAVFVLIGGDFYVWFGPRLLLPVVPFLLWLAGEGVYNLLLLLQAPAAARLPAQIILGALLLGWLVWFAWPGRWSRLEGLAGQMRAWKELGLWMQANLPPHTVIATDAAGLIPYFSGLPAIDMYGLTDTHIAHLPLSQPGAGIVAHEKYDPAYILARRPGCIVSTWVDKAGRPLSAGLDSVQEQFAGQYRLAAAAKSRGGAPSDGRWVLPMRVYPSERYAQGYQTGLYCLVE